MVKMTEQLGLWRVCICISCKLGLASYLCVLRNLYPLCVLVHLILVRINVFLFCWLLLNNFSPRF